MRFIPVSHNTFELPQEPMRFILCFDCLFACFYTAVSKALCPKMSQFTLSLSFFMS